MRTGRTRARRKSRPDFFTLPLILAAGACLFFGLTDAPQTAAVFARGQPAPQTVTLLLSQRQWYLVRDGGQSIAAYATLIDAEIARSAAAPHGEITPVQTDAIELRVTAEKRRAQVLREAAETVDATLSALFAMDALTPQERMEYAALRAVESSRASRAAQRRLSGVTNPVAMGLAGLANACASAMEALSQAADDATLARERAALATQYAAYAAYVEKNAAPQALTAAP